MCIIFLNSQRTASHYEQFTITLAKRVSKRAEYARALQQQRADYIIYFIIIYYHDIACELVGAVLSFEIAGGKPAAQPVIATKQPTTSCSRGRLHRLSLLRDSEHDMEVFRDLLPAEVADVWQLPQY
jgi:hypothetical protein